MVRKLYNSLMTYLSVFSPNVEKYGPEKTPYFDTFHAVFTLIMYNLFVPVTNIRKNIN